MRITKKQIAVITVLNIVIAALIGLFLWLNLAPRSSGNAGGTPDDDGTVDVGVKPTETHNKLRGPTAGKAKAILYETRLMGSGDESIVFSHTSGGVTYIFGNAVVGDLDFDSSGGFLCRIDSDGKIIGYTYFAGKLTAVRLAEGGFGAATISDAGTDEEKSALYSVDLDGNVAFVSELDGRAVDLISIGSKKLSVVTFPSANTVKLTEFNRAGSGWVVGKSTRVPNGLDIEYFGTFYKDEYTIAVRAHSETSYDAIAFYTFTAGGEATRSYYGGSDAAMITPYAVLPLGDGYIAACKMNGEATIVTISGTFTRDRRDMLGIQFDTASMLESGGKYYASFVGKTGTTTIEIDPQLDKFQAVPALDGTVPYATVNMDGTVYIASDGNTIRITDGNETKATLDITGAAVNRAFKLGHNEFLLALSARGGVSLSATSGGADVYLVRIKL